MGGCAPLLPEEPLQACHCARPSKDHIVISLQQIYKDKGIMREGENKKQMEKIINEQQ